jgi:hypothetical protein
MRSDARFAFLRERLLAAGVAPKRVRRYMTELSEHLDDLIRQQQALGYDGEDAQLRSRALLGSDDELAQGWLTDPRLKSFTARAPWAVIPAMTVATAILALALPFLAWIIIGHVGGWTGAHAAPAPAAFVQFSHFWSAATNFLMPPIVALMLALLVQQQRLNLAWAIVPAVGLLLIRLVLTMAPHSLSVGLGLNLWLDTEDRVRLLQIALTLAPGLWLALDRHLRRKQARPHAV